MLTLHRKVCRLIVGDDWTEDEREQWAAMWRFAQARGYPFGLVVRIPRLRNAALLEHYLILDSPKDEGEPEPILYHPHWRNAV